MTTSNTARYQPLVKVEEAWGTAKVVGRDPEVATAVFRNLVRVSNSKQNKRQELKRLRAEHKEKMSAKKPKDDVPKTDTKDNGGSFKFGTGKAEHAWWDEMSHDQQKAYLTEHPNSQMAQDLDKHISDTVADKKVKGEKLTDKEEEIAKHHYVAKVRSEEKGGDDPSEEDQEEVLEDVRPRKPREAKDESPKEAKDDDSEEIDEDEEVLEDVTKKKKKDPEIEKMIHGEKGKKILKSIQDDPNSALAKRVKAHLDAKDVEAEDLTKEEQALKDTLKKSKKSDDYEDEDESKHAKTDKELADIFDKDQGHEDRVAELEKDPSGKKSNNVLEVLAKKLASGGEISIKHKELLRTIEKARRQEKLTPEERENEQAAEKKLAEAKNSTPTKKDRGILKNIAKSMSKAVAKRVDDPTSSFYSFNKLKSGEDLTEVDKQNLKRAAMSVGKAFLLTAAFAGVACFAIGALPNLVTAWTEYMEKQGSGGTSVLSAADDKEVSDAAKEKVLAEYSSNFGEWLAEQNPKDFEVTSTKE